MMNPALCSGYRERQNRAVAMISSLPDSLKLNHDLVGNTLRELCDLTRSALLAARLPEIIAWAIPREVNSRSGGLDEEVNRLDAELAAGSAIGGRFELKGGSFIVFYRQPQTRGIWTLLFDLKVSKDDATKFHSLLDAAAEYCRALLRHDRLKNGVMFWQGGGAQCLPKVPLASSRSHLVVTSQEEARLCYEDADAFWQAGWDADEAYGEKRLLTRAMRVVSGATFLAEVQDHQWAMARAAKPKLTEYYLPVVLPDEVDIFMPSEPVIKPVGYFTDQRAIEYSCYLDPGVHVNGWEILNLLGLIRARELPTGEKIDVVRVVFFDREMAVREKRPLLDIGARVYFMDGSGQDVEITE
jgi:hypothetical protein